MKKVPIVIFYFIYKIVIQFYKLQISQNILSKQMLKIFVYNQVYEMEVNIW